MLFNNRIRQPVNALLNSVARKRNGNSDGIKEDIHNSIASDAKVSDSLALYIRKSIENKTVTAVMI